MRSYLHDVRKCRIARLVQAQVRAHDGGQRHFQRLDAAVDLTFDRESRAVVGDGQLARKGCLWPSQQACQHLRSLVGVIVNRLLAKQKDIRLVLRGEPRKQLRNSEWLQLGVGPQVSLRCDQ